MLKHSQSLIIAVVSFLSKVAYFVWQILWPITTVVVFHVAFHSNPIWGLLPDLMLHFMEHCMDDFMAYFMEHYTDDFMVYYMADYTAHFMVHFMANFT